MCSEAGQLEWEKYEYCIKNIKINGDKNREADIAKKKKEREKVR